jgi:hypothetical protein
MILNDTLDASPAAQADSDKRSRPPFVLPPISVAGGQFEDQLLIIYDAASIGLVYIPRNHWDTYGGNVINYTIIQLYNYTIIQV